MVRLDQKARCGKTPKRYFLSTAGPRLAEKSFFNADEILATFSEKNADKPLDVTVAATPPASCETIISPDFKLEFLKVDSRSPFKVTFHNGNGIPNKKNRFLD